MAAKWDPPGSECKAPHLQMGQVSCSLFAVLWNEEKTLKKNRVFCLDISRRERAENVMGAPNETIVTEFILIGLSEHPKAQAVFFSFLLMAYLISFLGNGLIVILIIADPHLHTPMYLFLCVLSSVDFMISNTFPEVLVNCFFYRPTISFNRCLVEMYVGVLLFVTECFLLAIMAYDRFAAICQPLHYFQIMSWRFCISLVAASVGLSSLSTVINVLLRPTDFCGHHIINHFVCELQSFLKLACSDTHTSELFMHLSSLFNVMLPFCFIVITYVRIGFAVLRISTTKGRKKAFSTCSSHLAVVSVFFGTIIVMYVKPQPKSSSDQDKVISILYGALTPMLNPLIYTLRNRDVKGAFWRLFGKKISQ
ncbi:olfactory receptor 13H1-like [Eublepharis macularius]|uniref:Olfactory receptor n=1 Tax=Eublepharis macularius TaxID=481883 RepID=A0AA97KPQ9_EUBMA|nr:olfactory receptor 13H1-like [Eublepharis macularius]